MRSGIRQAITAVRPAIIPRTRLLSHQPRRYLAVPISYDNQPVNAAPPINFNKFSRSRQDGAPPQFKPRDKKPNDPEDEAKGFLQTVRVVPVSPSYFTGKPAFTDDLLTLEALVRKYQTLPVLPPGEAPRVYWKTQGQYQASVSEPVRSARYTKLIDLLKRLNYIHPSLMPDEVSNAIQGYLRDVQPHHNPPKPIVVDEHGRARGIGRRKASTARAWVVEGDGQVLINGKSLTEHFGRLHDRESAIWALKATDRVDKYNVWAIVNGGGTTGQADALALAVSKALMVHEPDLKPALRRGMCSLTPSSQSHLLVHLLMIV